MSREREHTSGGAFPGDEAALALLEANVARLVQRAYVPVVPTPEFAARLERALPSWIAAAGRSGELRVRRTSVRRIAALAAAAVALVAALIVLRGGAGRPPELEELLARGLAARRPATSSTWIAIEPEAARVGVELAGAREEFATPAALALELRAGAGPAASLAPASRAAAGLGAEDELAMALERGACRLRSQGAGGRVRVASAPGELDLSTLPAVGALEAVLELVPTPAPLARPGAGERALLVRLDAGRARLARGDAAQGVEAPAVFLVHEGALFEPDGGARPVGRADAEAERTAVVPEPPAEPPASTAVLAGNVRALPSGEPIGRFRVLLLRAVDLPRVAETEWRDFEDKSGAFRWEGLEPGSYSVFVQADERAQFTARGLTLSAGAELALEVELVRGATVRGLVVDAATGAPVAGALVLSQTDAPIQVLPRFEDETTALVRAKAKTGPDGSFELRHLSRGEHELRASGLELAPSWVRTLPLRDGEVLDGTLFELDAGGSIHGSVMRGGEPVRGALLIASQFGSGSTASVMTFELGVTDAQGEYEIGHLSPGTYVVLLFEHADAQAEMKPEMSSTELAPGARVRVDFVQSAGTGALRGRVSLPDGAPLAGGTVSLGIPGEDGATGWRAAGIDADGVYAVSDLAPGAYDVHVGSGSGLVRQGAVTIQAGVELVRDFELSGGTLRCRILDARDRRPLQHVLLLIGQHVEPNGAEVFPSLDPLIGKSWTTGGEHFEFAYLRPGRYDLIAVGPDGGYGQVVVEDIAVEEGAVVEREVVLSPGGTLALSVSDPAGARVSDAEVELYDPRGRRIDIFLRGEVRPDGTRVTPDLEPGLWRAVVRAPGRPTLERSFAIESGSECALDLRFEQ